MERLSKILADVIDDIVNAWSQIQEETVKAAIDRLAYYEDLEEQGRLIVLPCPPDAIFWQVHGEVLAVSRFDGMTISGDGEMRWHDGDRSYTEDDFGKTVFLTRSEAEAALAASGKEGE